jgi:hypothetical protein
MHQDHAAQHQRLEHPLRQHHARRLNDAHPHAHPNTDPDPDAHTDCHANPDAHADPDADPDAHTDCHANPDTDLHIVAAGRNPATDERRVRGRAGGLGSPVVGGRHRRH